MTWGRAWIFDFQHCQRVYTLICLCSHLAAFENNEYFRVIHYPCSNSITFGNIAIGILFLHVFTIRCLIKHAWVKTMFNTPVADARREPKDESSHIPKHIQDKLVACARNDSINEASRTVETYASQAIGDRLVASFARLGVSLSACANEVNRRPNRTGLHNVTSRGWKFNKDSRVRTTVGLKSGSKSDYSLCASKGRSGCDRTTNFKLVLHWCGF